MHLPQRPGRVVLESVAERAENLVAPAPLPALGPAGRVKQRTDGYFFVEHCSVSATARPLTVVRIRRSRIAR